MLRNNPVPFFEKQAFFLLNLIEPMSQNELVMAL